MKLLVDAGNTRLKWLLVGDGHLVGSGSATLDAEDPFCDIRCQSARISARVAVSTVISEERRRQLQMQLEAFCRGPIVFHWAEPHRGGLVNAYAETDKMGADRWHAMYAAWQADEGGFAVVDAGSAITIDYVCRFGGAPGRLYSPG